MRDDDFKPDTKLKLAERAAYICSNPTCNRITIGPDNSNPTKSTKTGIASHITAASKLGPRYDISLTPHQRQSIANGIWLCGSCAIMVDKNNGLDYPTPTLRKWKKEHEQLVKQCLEGNKRLIFQFTNFSDQSKVCRRITKFLEDRGCLFVPLQYEIPYYVFESVKEIRTFLTQVQTQVEPDSPLEVMIDSIVQACRYFMNTTNSEMNNEEIGCSLGAMRKIIGINLKDMSKAYGIDITGQLKSILPK